MGSKNLRDSTSSAKDTGSSLVLYGADKGITEKSDGSRKGLLRSAISSIEKKTGVGITSETRKRK